jgi:hypothetical protein
LRIFSVLPRPVSPLVNPPRGHTPTPHRTPPQATETVNPYKLHPRTKAPGNAHKRPTTQAGHNDTNNRKTHAAGHDERRTQCTHAHERHKPGTRSQAFKACHVHPGRLFLIMFYVYRAAVHAQKTPAYNRGCKIIYSFLINQRTQRTEKLKYIIISILYTSIPNFSIFTGFSKLIN